MRRVVLCPLPRPVYVQIVFQRHWIVEKAKLKLSSGSENQGLSSVAMFEDSGLWKLKQLGLHRKETQTVIQGN